MFENIHIQDWFNGNIFNSDFAKQQRGIFFVVIAWLLVIVLVGYKGQRQQSELVRLEKELQDAQYEYLTLQAELSTMTRQSVITAGLQEAGSAVHESNIPATRIE